MIKNADLECEDGEEEDDERGDASSYDDRLSAVQTAHLDNKMVYIETALGTLETHHAQTDALSNREDGKQDKVDGKSPRK